MKSMSSLSIGARRMLRSDGWIMGAQRSITASSLREAGGGGSAIVWSGDLWSDSRGSAVVGIAARSCWPCWSVSSRPFSTSFPSSSFSSSSYKHSFYDDLEIHPQSSSREVKEAFYRLSKIHHPDANAENAESLKRFQAISEAYEVLSNPQRREKYDKGVLGRTSSVAEREQASHKFEQENFYGSRSGRESATRSQSLDDWVTKQRSHSFRESRARNERLGSHRNSSYNIRLAQRRDANVPFSVTLFTCFSFIFILFCFLRS